MVTNAYHDQGVRIFVEFGPRGPCSELIAKILAEYEDVETVSLGADMRECELQLRKSVVKLAVLGVELENFDKWAAPESVELDGEDATTSTGAKPSPFEKVMSAPSYKSKKVVEEQTKIMNDGYKLVCVRGKKEHSEVTKVKQELETQNKKRLLLQSQLKQAEIESRSVSKQARAVATDLQGAKKMSWSAENAKRHPTPSMVRRDSFSFLDGGEVDRAGRSTSSMRRVGTTTSRTMGSTSLGSISTGISDLETTTVQSSSCVAGEAMVRPSNISLSSSRITSVSPTTNNSTGFPVSGTAAAPASTTTTAAPVATPNYRPGQIAVVALEARAAGSLVSTNATEEFWTTLRNGKSVIKPVTKNRLGFEPQLVSATGPATGYNCKNLNGGFFEEEVKLLDLASSLAESVLGQLCEKLPPGTEKTLDKKRMGVILGHLSFPLKETHEFFKNLYDGSDVSNIKVPEYLKEGMDPASFVAKKYGLSESNAFSFDAACASGLYGLKIARDFLNSKKCDVVLAGCVNTSDPFFLLNGFTAFRAMPVAAQQDQKTVSSNADLQEQYGRVSVPLDSKSKGLNPGEGGAMVALKRYEDAVRDGDTIHGVLVDVEVSNTGRGLPLKPVLEGEVECMKAVYERSGVNPKKQVQYVECHATGTPVGDKIELDAMSQVFDTETVLYGSSKGNFGHTLVTAGMFGLIKVLLQMKHNTLCPTPNVHNPVSKNVVFGESRSWPEASTQKMAGISAFGFGGTNAHALVAESGVVFSDEQVDFVASTIISQAAAVPPTTAPVNIIGMGAIFGDNIRNLQDFRRFVLSSDEVLFSESNINEHVRWGPRKTSMAKQILLDSNILTAADIKELAVHFADIQVSIRFSSLPAVRG